MRPLRANTGILHPEALLFPRIGPFSSDLAAPATAKQPASLLVHTTTCLSATAHQRELFYVQKSGKLQNVSHGEHLSDEFRSSQDAENHVQKKFTTIRPAHRIPTSRSARSSWTNPRSAPARAGDPGTIRLTRKTTTPILLPILLASVV